MKNSMKMRSAAFPGSLQGGFTRLELVVVLLAIAMLIGLVMHSHERGRYREKAIRTRCSSNLKAMGTAERIWANDHGGSLPGWQDILKKPNQGALCWTNYAILIKTLGDDPYLFVCPSDERRPATNLIVKGSPDDHGNADFKDNTTVSYFVGVDANDANPRNILNGDRNLGPGAIPDPNYGYSPANGQGNDVTVPVSGPVSWSLKMHSRGNPRGAGNIVLGDGSVQQVSSSAVSRCFAGSATTNWPTGCTPPVPSIRLIFP
jgi:hypothetical protein